MNLPLNCHRLFWKIYGMPPGKERREALLALFQSQPGVMLPVNNKWQAKEHDPDLQKLLKKGLIVKVRPRGKFKTSFHRQSYLVLK